MRVTRREVCVGSMTAIGTMLMIPRPLYALLGAVPEAVPSIEDPRLKELCSRSLDGAISRGATYADIRLTHTYQVGFNLGFPIEEYLSIGIRALVDGYWGFAASPIWSLVEAERLGRAAAEHAASNLGGKRRETVLAPVDMVSNGHWATPIEEDPFEINRAEITDYLDGLTNYIKRQKDWVAGVLVGFKSQKQEKAFASTEGSYCTQRLYTSTGMAGWGVSGKSGKMGASISELGPAGRGFELMRGRDLYETVRQKYDETRQKLLCPLKAVDVGRYDMVFDAQSMAEIVSKTIGQTTELDRALGYDANAGGTSYVTEPDVEIGTLKIGSLSLTIGADRTTPGGAATVAWDDEGVKAQAFPLVNQGVLAGMQNTREGAGWLGRQREAYAGTGSNGCAYTPDAGFSPLTHTANLKFQNSTENGDVDHLMAGLQKGISFEYGSFDLDMQGLSGFGRGTVYEVRGGKRVARLAGGGIIFRTPEFLNSITAIGGPATTGQFGQSAAKGEPVRTSCHTVTAPAVIAKEQTLIDILRKG